MPAKSQPLSVAELIRQSRDLIVAEWEQAVRPLLPAGTDRPALLDHVPELLLRVAERLDECTPHSEAEVASATQEHALARLDAGVDLRVVIAEYAELRRCILRLWERATGPIGVPGEIERINGALDEAMLETVSRFTRTHQRTLEALDRLSVFSLDSPDLGTFFARLLDVFRQHAASVDVAALYLRAADELVPRATIGLEGGAPRRVRIGRGFVGEIAAERRPRQVLCADGAPPETACPAETSVVYGVPLVHRDELVGVVYMGSKSATEFSEADRQLLRVLANRATTHIVHHQLVDAERGARAQAERTTVLLDTVLRTAPVGLAFVGPELRFVRVNEVLAELSGLSIDQHLGRTVREVLPGLAAQLEPLLLQVLETGEPAVLHEVTGETSDHPGEVRHWLVSHYPIKGGAGTVELVGSVVMEITDRKRRAQHSALRADVGTALNERTSLQAVLQRCAESVVHHLDAAFARVWLFDEREGVLRLHASAGLYTHLDGPHGRIRIGDLKIGRIAQERRAHLSTRVLEDPWVGDEAWARREGMVSFAGYPLVIGERLLGVIALFSRSVLPQDSLDALGSISALLAEGIERRRAEERLAVAEREQRFLAEASVTLSATLHLAATFERAVRLVVANLADWSVLDLAQDDGRVEQVAAAHADPAKEPLALDLRARFPVRADAPHGVARVLRTGEPEIYPDVSDPSWRAAGLGEDHSEFLRGLGARSYLCVPLRARGRVIGALSVISTQETRRYGEAELRLAQDLCRRVEVAIDNARLHEEAERARDQAQRAVLMRDNLMAVLSHDLRDPLSAVAMNAALMLKETPEGEDRTRRRAAAIQRAAGRTARMIDDILSASAIEAGKVTLHPKPHDAAALAREALEQHLPLALESSLRLVLDVAGEPGQVLCDPDQVARVFSNLLGNAFKFSPAGTTVSIRVERVGGAVRFAVSDEGPGVPAQLSESIFERGFQAARPAQEGLGLGLSIAKGLIDAHGGQIGVESEEGAGATFWFALPAV